MVPKIINCPLKCPWGRKRFQEFPKLFQLHLEFATPAEVVSNSQGRGNSGVIIYNRYEVQVLDSYGKMKMGSGEMKNWQVTLYLDDPEKSTLRLALNIDGVMYYAETTAVFVDYETSFSRDNFVKK